MPPFIVDSHRLHPWEQVLVPSLEPQPIAAALAGSETVEISEDGTKARAADSGMHLVPCVHACLAHHLWLTIFADGMQVRRFPSLWQPKPVELGGKTYSSRSEVRCTMISQGAALSNNLLVCTHHLSDHSSNSKGALGWIGPGKATLPPNLHTSLPLPACVPPSSPQILAYAQPLLKSSSELGEEAVAFVKDLLKHHAKAKDKEGTGIVSVKVRNELHPIGKFRIIA